MAANGEWLVTVHSIASIAFVGINIRSAGTSQFVYLNAVAEEFQKSRKLQLNVSMVLPYQTPDDPSQISKV